MVYDLHDFPSDEQANSYIGIWELRSSNNDISDGFLSCSLESEDEVELDAHASMPTGSPKQRLQSGRLQLSV